MFAHCLQIPRFAKYSMKSKTVAFRIPVNVYDQLKVDASATDGTVSDMLLEAVTRSQRAGIVEAELAELKDKVARLTQMYEQATAGKRPNVETKKVTLTLSLSAAKALDDAAHAARTTKSKLVNAALEKQDPGTGAVPRLAAS